MQNIGLGKSYYFHITMYMISYMFARLCVISLVNTKGKQNRRPQTDRRIVSPFYLQSTNKVALVDVVRAQVTLSGVGQEHHYTLAFIFSSLSHFNGGFKCCTRGVTAQDAFLGSGQVGGFNGVLVAHLNHLVKNIGIEHVGYKTGTNALNFMGTGLTAGEDGTCLRLYGNDLDIGIALL